MKTILAFAFTTLVVGASSMTTPAQTSTQVSIEPAVVAAVAPVFGPVARSARAKGDVVVEVAINTRGQVDDAKIISGHALLQAASKAAATKWRFAVDDRLKRMCRLTFSFGYLEGGKSDPEYTTTFMPPYRVELRWNPAEEADFKNRSRQKSHSP